MTEYHLQQHRASQRNITRENEDQWLVLTDFTQLNSSAIPVGILNNTPSRKLFRNDISIVKGTKVIEHVMCWPMVPSIDEEYKMEDFPDFNQYKTRFGHTRVEVSPIPWFNCEIFFYPSAEAVMGLIDLWFMKWYQPYKKAGTFLNVVHGITGPYKEETGGVVFYIDFGTAPARAFTDLLMQVCRMGVEKIVIK